MTPAAPPATGHAFAALGTRWEVAGDALDLAPALRALDDLDRTWSRFREDSVVAHVARRGGVIPLDPATTRLLDLYDRLDALTGGAVNPLVGGSLEALGYDASYSLVAGAPVAAPPWRDVVRTPERLELPAPCVVDIGAAGKGLAVDLVAEALDRPAGALHWVDASGDLWNAPGHRPLRVALEDPADPAAAVGVVEVAPGQAIAASATNRRAWGDGLHHVLDARTGEPVRRVIATWAIADSALLADGAATALFFAAADRVAADLGVVAVRLLSDRTVDVGDGFTGEVFT
ncbi:FAD:protein FMN transferase [Nocardioides humi]|uniref:FAD:protein FMN transferase n=1 Tax=Nocardioides humi TaxID=449461 RepID=A0ABN2B8F8_9ACTN|nr:FAD:protein FMN transferase [Nocardioides humi]